LLGAECTSPNTDRIQQITAKYKFSGQNYRELADPVKYMVIRTSHKENVKEVYSLH